MEEYTIDLVFETDKRSTLTISVPKADPSVTGGQAAAAMNRIIAAGCVCTPAGEPVAIRKAELVATATECYDVS